MEGMKSHLSVGSAGFEGLECPTHPPSRQRANRARKVFAVMRRNFASWCSLHQRELDQTPAAFRLPSERAYSARTKISLMSSRDSFPACQAATMALRNPTMG